MPTLTLTPEAPLESASDAARHSLEDMMTTMEWKDEWVENYFKEIRELAIQRARP
jgi:hypothetical protein